jgi:hypothetical protein
MSQPIKDSIILLGWVDASLLSLLSLSSFILITSLLLPRRSRVLRVHVIFLLFTSVDSDLLDVFSPT